MLRHYARRLAIAAGLALPIVETMRRWRELGDPAMWPFWLDDWAIGTFLLYGAWRARAANLRGLRILAAAWGFACGMAYCSFFSQLAAIGQPDPSGISSVTVVVIKGVMFALAVAALAATLLQTQE